MWFGLNDGYWLSKRLFGHGGWPVWLGVGFGGVWPLSLPWPVRVRQRIGEPIDVRAFGSLDDPRALEAAHRAVTGKIQSMLDELEAASARAFGELQNLGGRDRKLLGSRPIATLDLRGHAGSSSSASEPVAEGAHWELSALAEDAWSSGVPKTA